MSDQIIQPNKRREIEEKIIHLCLKSRAVIEELLESGFAPDYFELRHQNLISAIYAEFLDSNRLLTTETYRHRLTLDGVKGELTAKMSIFARCLVGVFAVPDDLSYLKDKLIDNYVARSANKGLESFVKESKSKGFFFATKNLIDSLNSAVSLIEFKKSVFASLDESKDDYIKYVVDRRENPGERIECDFPEIDDAVNVGFKPQHMTLFVGDIGSHKTNLMINVGLNIWKRGSNVLFLPLEMNRLDLMDRIVANLLRIRHDLLAKPELLSEEDLNRIKEGFSEKKDCCLWHPQNNSKFSILDMDERTSVSALQREIEKRTYIFKPKVVIIDYIANLKPDMRFGQRNDLEIGEILKNLRFLGKKHGFHTISAAQLGRDAIRALREDSNATPDSTAVRGSHEYSADADNIFILMKVRGELDKLRIHRLKARHGRAGDTKELYVEPEFCRISSTEKMSEIAAKNLVSQDVDFINESPEEISKSVNVEFASMDLDDTDDILGV